MSWASLIQHVLWKYEAPRACQAISKIYAFKTQIACLNMVCFDKLTICIMLSITQMTLNHVMHTWLDRIPLWLISTATFIDWVFFLVFCFSFPLMKHKHYASLLYNLVVDEWSLGSTPIPYKSYDFNTFFICVNESCMVSATRLYL